MATIVLVCGALIAAVQAIRSRQLIAAALWLAGVSAFVSLLLYGMGAQNVAVIELSVGAGLVTILFVFAISITGAGDLSRPSVLPRALAGGLTLLMLAVLGWWMVAGMAPPPETAVVPHPAFTVMLWQERGLDVLLQIGLIFGAVMCILGLLTDVKEIAPAETAVSQRKEQDEPEPTRVTVPH